MEKIGMKHNFVLIKGSQLTILFWVFFSLITSLILNKGLNLEHILTSLIFYSIFFIPIYFIFISFIFNKNIYKRLIISILSLIPVLISYFVLFSKMDFLPIDPFKTIFIILMLFMINIILSQSNKYYFIIISTLLNISIPIYIYYSFLNNYSHLKIYVLIGLYNQDQYIFDTYLIIGLFIQIILVFIYYIMKLLKLRKREEYAGNS